MNLSVLRQMINNGDMSTDALRYLINSNGECEWLDFKIDFDLSNEKALCDFTKDVLGMKNVGGGYIIIGVQDKTWKPIGLEKRLPYDTKLLRDKIRHSANISLDIDIVHHELYFTAKSGLFAMILVRASAKHNKRHMPTLVGKDFCINKSFGLRRGEIYCRKGDSTIKIDSTGDLERVLDTLEAQTNQDAMLVAVNQSPFAVEDGTYRLLEKGFEHFIGRQKLRTGIIEAVTRDPRIWIVNVHGPGGVGKSALVNWATYEFYQSRIFEAILQLTAKETILTSQGIQRASRTLYSLENLLDQVLALFGETPPTELETKKKMVVEYLSAWKTLIVLDNMETVNDGRILDFVQHLPPESQTKVLMTSRQKTGGWELPFSVDELKIHEVGDFLDAKTQELGISFSNCRDLAKQIWQASGGLPLAIQWILGKYKITGNLDLAIDSVDKKDSPILEFSFGNIWKVLSDGAKATLAIMTIFEEPPTIQQIVIATEFKIEKVEDALAELCEVTLVAKCPQNDSRIRYIALPITLSFARHQLQSMDDFEITCRRRFQKFTEQMELQESESYKFKSIFDLYGLRTDNEKRAAILCKRGESETFIGNVDNADLLFKQARDLAPQSSYIFAMNASYDLTRNRIGLAIEHIEEACRKATQSTGALCYTIKARILDVQQDHNGRVSALAKAVEYAPEDNVVRHQYGVALSRASRSDEAIKQFSIIIEKEKAKITPTSQMLMALKTRMINLNRTGRLEEYNRDKNLVSAIFRDYPHLMADAEHFTEFFKDLKK